MFLTSIMNGLQATGFVTDPAGMKGRLYMALKMNAPRGFGGILLAYQFVGNGFNAYF